MKFPKERIKISFATEMFKTENHKAQWKMRTEDPKEDAITEDRKRTQSEIDTTM